MRPELIHSATKLTPPLTGRSCSQFACLPEMTLLQCVCRSVGIFVPHHPIARCPTGTSPPEISHVAIQARSTFHAIYQLIVLTTDEPLLNPFIVALRH
jgi:hypothetical protein